VIEQACRQVARWQQLNPDAAPLSVAVNLSPRQIADPDLLSHIEGSIRANHIDPSTLWLELTETTLLDETTFVERSLEALKGLGVRLVLDDFGTGYSSFQHLKDFPIDKIKIDRSFVANLGRSEQDRAIVASVISMASTLGIDVVAEGVETKAQADLLRELGCPMAQGYYFAPPA